LTINSCGSNDKKVEQQNIRNPALLSYEVIMTLEHDPSAYTQGLVFYNDKIIESTGGDDSWIAEFDIASGSYERKVTLDEGFFGEGITVLNDKIYQLTWKSKTGFIYNAKSYKKIGEFSYDFEGWGITTDNKHLIISDGTNKLHFLDSLSLTEVYVKIIMDKTQQAAKLNELEFIEGFIYANQWETNLILKIDLNKSEVVNKMDLNYLANNIKKRSPRVDVLNGIAYNPKTRDILITGKLWPESYLIRLQGNDFQ